MSMTATDGMEVRELSGVQKAALVLVNMSTERAAAVLRNFGEDEAVAIAQEMTRLRATSGREAERAIRAFRDHSHGTAGTETGSNKAVVTTMIQEAFAPERATAMLERIELSEASVSFAFVDDAAPSDVVAVLEYDAPSTVAFVLVQLGPDTAAKVLMSLETQRRLDVAQAIATMGTPTPEAGGIVAEALRSGLRRRTDAPMVDTEDSVGSGDGTSPALPALRVQPLVDIMNHAQPADEGELIEGLMGRDAVLAAEIRAKLLSFEDVPRLADRDLQQVLRGLDIATLALALKGADAAIADAMKSNMSERNREAMAEETTNLGRVPKSRVDEARNQVVRAMRELAGTQGLELKKPAGEAGEAPAEETPDEAEPEEEYVN